MKLFFYSLLCIHFFFYAQNIGSDSEITRFINTVVLTQGDRIASFASIENGFAFFDVHTTATFDSFFNVSGDIALNDGTLILTQDLFFGQVSSIQTLGNITGNNHTLSLSPSMDCIPMVPTSTPNCIAILLDSDTVANNVRTSDWSFDSKFIALTIEGNPGTIAVYEEIGATLSLLDSITLGGANNRLRCIRWHPTKYCFAVARLSVGGGAAEIFTYDFDTTTKTIVTPEISSVDLGTNGFAVAWHPNGELLGVLKSGAPEVQVYEVNNNCAIQTPAITTFDLPGNKRGREHAFDWNLSGTYLLTGANNAGGADDFFVLQFDVNTKTFNPTVDAAISFGTNVFAAQWNKVQEDLIGIGLDGTTDRIRVYRHTPGSLTQLASITAAVDVNSVAWSPNGICLACGRDGSSLQTYEFDVVNNALTLVTDTTVAGNQVETVRYAPNGTRLFLGTLGGTDTIALYRTNAGTIIIETADCFTFSDLKVFLNCNVALKDCCITFTGNSVINGQGNCLSLSSTCSLIVDTNSDLLIKNIKVTGIDERRIVGTDSTSTFSFKNTEFVLNNDFTFDTGHFDVIGDFTISGNGHTFNYETDQVSTVSSCGNLILDTGVTFKYNPLSGADNLLHFTDQTAHLTMQNATLDVVDALDLLKGTIFVDGCSTFTITGSPAQLTLGDGNDIDNNMCMHILPAAKLQIIDGTLVHKNI